MRVQGARRNRWLAIAGGGDAFQSAVKSASAPTVRSLARSLGLSHTTVSDALRMMLTRVAREHSLPFDPLVPNATTVKAMREARRGKTTKHKSLEDLMADLHADD